MSNFSLRNQIEKFRQSFIQQGFDRRDIEITLDIFAVMASLDQALFPDNVAGIRICLVPHRKKFIAQHSPRVKGKQKEHYTIFMPGLYESWKNDNSLVLMEEKGSKVKVLPKEKRRKITRNEFVVMVAAHEVRHRLQFQRGQRLKKINSWTWKKAQHPLLRELGEFVYFLKSYERKHILQEGCRKAFARKRTNAAEFDSTIIEYLVLHRFKRIKGLDDLVKLVTIGPESVL